MELKTKIDAQEGKQDLVIIREFDLPLELLFKAYTLSEIIEQWMGTKVLKLENKKHGGYQFETTDPKGNKYRFNGAIHDFVPDQKITRTFEFENMPFGVQLEFLVFEKLSDDTSKLTIRSMYETAVQRDQQLKYGMTQGINMAHNRLQEIVHNLK
ncbi:MAG TPA: SRPBCC domain-containing protein [Bacteroidia bacterium]|nr:SRPBCC domain-containing protein [Bacteroidia bacterium]